jgi:hypothetical protein
MKIIGFAQALKDLQALEEKTQRAAQRAINRTANKIVNEAKRDAPGSLKAGIFNVQSPMTAEIHGGDDLAAYVNFGTGQFAKEYVATLSPEQQAEAMKFFVNGEGHNPENPFFTNSVIRNSPQLLIEVELELKKIFK